MKRLSAFIACVVTGCTLACCEIILAQYAYNNVPESYQLMIAACGFIGFMGVAVCSIMVGHYIEDNIK